MSAQCGRACRIAELTRERWESEQTERSSALAGKSMSDRVHARRKLGSAYAHMEEARMEKKEWITPAVESDSAFETLAATCTATAETPVRLHD